MKKFALIGRDIKDSGSPALFQAAYNGRYSYDLLDGGDFSPLFARFLEEYDAVNVTAPFKTVALETADSVSETASLCGAANILMKMPGGGVAADNSDFEGVTLSLTSAYAVADVVDVDDEDAFADYLAGKTVLIAGCSGAGMAAAAAAVTLGYGHTILMNRSERKAQELRSRIMGFYDDLATGDIEVLPLSAFQDAFSKADAVIYTIPAAICNMSALNAEGKFILESNYKNPLLDKLEGRYNYIGGLNWLYNQAVVAYEEFTGEKPDEEKMRKVLGNEKMTI